MTHESMLVGSSPSGFQPYLSALFAPALLIGQYEVNRNTDLMHVVSCYYPLIFSRP